MCIPRHSISDLSIKEVIEITSLQDPVSCTACAHNDCIYIIDMAGYIHRMGLPARVKSMWHIFYRPGNLSISKHNSLLVIAFTPPMLHEYSTEGNPIRTILLPGY